MFNGKTVFAGSLSYVVRLTFQSFDQFHSDSQAPFQLFRLFWRYFSTKFSTKFFLDNEMKFSRILTIDSLIKYEFENIESNIIFVLVLWLINIGLWHQQCVATKLTLSQSNSTTIRFSFQMMMSIKLFQQFFIFIRIWTFVLFEQHQICRRLWTRYHAWARFVSKIKIQWQNLCRDIDLSLDS